jgi:hypothetical protein
MFHTHWQLFYLSGNDKLFRDNKLLLLHYIGFIGITNKKFLMYYYNRLGRQAQKAGHALE